MSKGKDKKVKMAFIEAFTDFRFEVGIGEKENTISQYASVFETFCRVLPIEIHTGILIAIMSAFIDRNENEYDGKKDINKIVEYAYKYYNLRNKEAE